MVRPVTGVFYGDSRSNLDNFGIIYVVCFLQSCKRIMSFYLCMGAVRVKPSYGTLFSQWLMPVRESGNKETMTMNKEQVNICLSPSEIGRIKRAYNHFIQRNGFYDKDGKKRTFNTWLKDALLSQTRKELTAK